jgi:hypothetical protein
MGIQVRILLILSQYLRQNAFWSFFDKRVISRMTKDQAVTKQHIIQVYPFLSTGEGIAQ